MNKTTRHMNRWLYDSHSLQTGHRGSSALKGIGHLIILCLLASGGYPALGQEHSHSDERHPSPQESQEEHDEEQVVHLSRNVLEEFNIRTSQIGPGVLHEEVILPGEIQFNRETLAYVTPRYEGTILSIHARLADRVESGDLLARLESTETLQEFEVTAPFDGVIVAYDVTPGQTVQAGTALFTVANLETVWADLQIYQRHLPEVHEGLPVTIEGSHDQVSYAGTLAYIAPTLDKHTRTGLARVVVDNTAGQWRPGQFIKGRVSTEEHQVALLVPRSAILSIDGETIVFVEEEQGVFTPRHIQLGHSDAHSFEILSGLEAGETIVVQNAISLKAEMGKGSFGGHHH